MKRRSKTTSRIYLSGFFLALLISVPVAADSNNLLSAEIERAAQQLNGGFYNESVKTCKRVRDKNPLEEETCLLIAAMAGNGSGNFKAAGRAAEKLITLQGRFKAVGHREMARSLLGRLQVSPNWQIADARTRHGVAKQKARKAVKSLQVAEGHLRQAMKEGLADDNVTRLNLANTLFGLMVHDRQFERQEEVRDLLLSYLEDDPAGPQADWARQVTCTDERYQDLTWDADIPLPRRSGKRGAWGLNGPYSPVIGGPQLTQEDVLDRPIKKHGSNPQYTPLARQLGIQGVVIAQVVVDKSGKVSSVRPIKGLPFCLTEEAMLAFKEFRYEPAKLNDQPVDVYYHLTATFRLGRPWTPEPLSAPDDRPVLKREQHWAVLECRQHGEPSLSAVEGPGVLRSGACRRR